MKRFIATKIDNHTLKIEGGEHHHLKNVLRLMEGDSVICIVKDNYDYYCKITSIERHYTFCEVVNTKENQANPKIKLTVFQALTKKDSMNLTVQKLNELGATKIYPFQSEFTTAKDKDNKQQQKLQEIALQSSKQCGRSMPLIVESTLSFKEMLDNLDKYNKVIFANEKEAFNTMHTTYPHLKSQDNVAIVVGSEGGFSESEIELILKKEQVESVSLGRRILRAETACIALSALVLVALKEI